MRPLQIGLILYFLGSTLIFGFTNLGTDFILCYPGNACREPVGFPIPPASHFNGQIILTSTWATTGTIRNWNGTWTRAFTIPPNSVTTVSVDSTLWLRQSETVLRKGLRIQSNNPISAYFLSYETPGATNDLALIYPIPSLGTEYITMCWRDNLPTAPGGPAMNRGPSMLAIVAPFDGTNVTITTPVATEGGHAAGVPWTVTLQSYECYQVLANAPNTTTLRDLTGTVITSDRPIAVFSGSQLAFIPDGIMAADYLLEQMPPVVAWGKTFNTFPIRQRNYWGKDVIRVLASENATSVTVTDAGGTYNFMLNRGQYWEWNGQPCTPGSWLADGSCAGLLLDGPTTIVADKPILVGQFIMGGTLVSRTNILGQYTNPLGDPAFMLVPPIEQYSKRYIFLTPSGYNNDFLNITIPAGHEGSVTVDGGPPVFVTPWFNILSTPYRGARISLAPGAHVLEADTTMLLLMYGYDSNWASYASVAGQNLNPINAEYSLIKYCERTPTMSGTFTVYRIVLIQNSGDPSHGIIVRDTLPPGFTLAGPATISLFGAASRDSILNPPVGASNLAWGWFSMRTGDSIVISFTANIAMGVEGRFDNGARAVNDSGRVGSNLGGLLGDQDDCIVILPSRPVADAGPDHIICRGDNVTIGGSPTAFSGTPPYTISWSSIPPGFTSSAWNPTVSPSVGTFYIVTVTDNNGFTDVDTCFVSIAGPPSAVITTPNPCRGVTTCQNQQIIWRITDTLGLLPESTVVRVNGTVYRLGANLTVASAGIGVWNATFTPSPPGWDHYDTVVAILEQAMNVVYCEMGLPPCTFFVDLRPPMITDTIPPHRAVIHDSIPSISLTIRDEPAGVNPGSFSRIRVLVDGVLRTGWTYSWDGTRLNITGLRFQNGDTVRICLDSLYDDPDYNYCPPNDTSFCWEFYVVITTPRGHIVEPLDRNGDGVVSSACLCQPILIYLRDDSGIDPATIRFQVDGYTMTIADPRLIYFADTLRFTPTMPCWTEGVHTFSLLEARNIYGAPLPAPISGSVRIDLTPPYFTGITPAPGSFVGGSPTVSISVHDAGLGIVPGEVYITIEGVTYRPPRAGITWDGTNFTANLAALGLSFPDGTVIDFCLMGARDNPDYCPPNANDTCWTLIVNLAVPTATVIVPAPGIVSACANQGVVWLVSASNGINPTTATVFDGSRTYRFSDPELSYSPIDARNGRLSFNPSISWAPYDTITVCLTALADSMDHWMEDTVCITYYTDLVPPAVYGVTPLPGTIVGSTSPAIYFCVNDPVALVDGNSLRLTIEGIPYSFGSGWFSDDTCFTWNAVAYGVRFRNGDTISICIHATDDPDTCMANVLDSCWTLIMPPPQVYAHAGVDVTICPGDSIALGCVPSAYAGIPPYIYTWTQIAGPWTSNLPNPFVRPLVTTTYILHVRDSSPAPTEDWDTVTIFVDYIPPSAPILVSPPAGALLPPAPSPINLVWRRVTTGTTPILYDVLIDGIVVARNLTDTTFTVSYPCEHTHRWTVIAKNTCATEYFYCYVDTLGDSTYTFFGVADTHSTPSLEVSRVFNTYPCGGPVPRPERPMPGTYTACDPESIIIFIVDTAAILDTSIVLRVNGIVFTTMSPFLRFVPDSTLIFRPPAGFFTDGMTVIVELIRALNRFGVNIADTLRFSFIVDYSPPVISALAPPAGGYAPGSITSAGFDAVDALSGVNPTTTWLSVNGTRYNFGHSCVTWSGGRFTLDLTCAGYSFARGDTVRFCAGAGDSPDYCAPNTDSTCWNIYIIDCAINVTITTRDTIICGAPDTVIIPINANVTGALPPVTYNWANPAWFIDPSVEDPIARLPFIAGTYALIVRVVDSTGCTDFDTVRITMSRPGVNAGGDIWVCPGGAGVVGCPPITMGSPIPPINIRWLDLDGRLISTDSIFSVMPESTITYVVRLVDGVGCTAFDTMTVHYDHVPPGPFTYRSPIPNDTLAVGNVRLCWEMPTGTRPIYFDVYLDGSLQVEGITDTCWTVGPFDCGEYHEWFIESYNYCVPINCAGETLWVWDPLDSTWGGIFVPGDTFAGGFDPPFYTTLCPTGSPEIIEPLAGTWSSCNNQRIILQIVQPDSGLPLNPATIRLRVEGTRYSVDGTTLIWADPVLTFVPPVLWTNGQTVDVCVDSARDTDGNTVNNLPFCWSFFIDLVAPSVSLINPPLGNLIVSPTGFTFNMTDAGSGINLSSVVAVVNGTAYPFDGTILSYSAPILTFSASSAGLVWVPGDSIIIEIIAGDSPNYCAPNVDTTRFAWFVRDPNAPVPSIVSPNDGDFSACDPESIVIRILDNDGVDPTTIVLVVNGVTYTVASPELRWNAPLLVFRPSPMWANGTIVNVSLTHVADIFGNDISIPLTFSFTIDLMAPNANMTLPVPSSMVRDIRQDIGITLTDPLSGVNIGITELIVNNDTLRSGSFAWTPDGSGGGAILFVPESNNMTFVAGETVFVALNVYDSPDRCGPNRASFDWWFVIEPEVSCAVFPNPFTPNNDNINDRAFFSYPFMLSEKATIVIFDMHNVEVWRSDVPVQTDIVSFVGRTWDGRDNNGQSLKQGLYLYVIKVNDEVQCNGTVLLLR